MKQFAPTQSSTESGARTSTYVHDLVDRCARAAPEAIAVTAGNRKLNYRDLNNRANQLANALRAAGVTAEVPVAVFLERSPELVVAVLAVLKAGGAYVPLDPGYPSSRISMLLGDCDAPLVITHSSLLSRIPDGKWQTIAVDSQAAEIGKQPTVGPDDQVKPEQLAYIIFTSGSTGRPKGVQITHANLLNLVHWHHRAFQVTAADRATLQASPGFDAAVWELWPYLTIGASVHVVDEELRTSPDRLRDWIVSAGITITFLPTAMAECMIDLPWLSNAPLRILLTGADTLRRYPAPGLPFALVNNYGPTECTVVATSGTISPNQKPGTLPSIGLPIDGVEVHIVDEQLNRVPQGASGELLIGGASVGRGYVNRPELTADKFVADPFTDAPGARLYCTGDLARVLPDGQIEFLGRMDEQIKIMGYRIEPGEITAALDRHPAIASSCVIAVTGESGERQVVAYVVPAPGASLSASGLREFLSTSLPDYMLPSLFVSLASLPINASGKIDRKALPKPTADNIVDDGSFEAPQSEIEQWLAKFLTNLLGLTRVGRDDNFFSLGGHSLMGAQLIAKIHQTFGVELSLRSLFDHPTLREISLEIENLVHDRLNAMSDDEARHLLDSSPPGISV